MKIKEEEIVKRKDEICQDCKHKLSLHVFWNTRGYLELLNCNICFCERFRKPSEARK